MSSITIRIRPGTVKRVNDWRIKVYAAGETTGILSFTDAVHELLELALGDELTRLKAKEGVEG